MAYYAETGRSRPPNRETLWITLIKLHNNIFAICARIYYMYQIFEIDSCSQYGYD